MQENIQEKKKARETARNLLKEWAMQNRPQADHKISLNLIKFLQAQSPLFSSSKLIVGIFAPLPNEPIWTQAQEIEKAYELAFPEGEQGTMLFRQCGFQELEKAANGLGVLSAPKCAKFVIPQVLVVPGMAFSWSGKRLGRGKGYYDCYLKNYKGITAALSFSINVWDDLPVEAHDQSVRWLITDVGNYDCRSKSWV